MDYTIASIAPIVLMPFFAFVINAFLGERNSKLASWISCAAIILSFFYCFRIFRDFVFNTYNTNNYIHKTFTWFDLSAVGVSNFAVEMGIYIDNMTAIMLLMVAGTATLIHIFSTYYMKGDARYGRFFVYLSLFTSAMLGLVLSDNLLSLFIFWEIMGFCSYSLIGFYYEKEGAGNASIKAFMTTRVGDVFLLIGIIAIWTAVGSVSYVDIYNAISDGTLNGLTAIGLPLVTFAGFTIFLGTIGKSAQFPLQVWLPDAMWGPTPCSALIHAATMVAAGVYLSLRMYPLMEVAGLLPMIAYIGAITAFGAATIALIQTDLKAVLAYSTISQLGYMVLGIGVEAYTASFMHLITHAVFKACLFLAAGSVIHSLHDPLTHGHVQEMPRMGGLRKKLPYTFFAMLLCTFAIAGFPFFSGFVSKDRILGDALHLATLNGTYWVPTILGFMAAFLTAFYMFRMMFLTFFGEPRDKEVYEHTHLEKISWNRNVPLLILAMFTLGAWFCGSLTGQKIVKVPGVQNIEWFETLVQKPKLDDFSNYESQPFGRIDTRESIDLGTSVYDPYKNYTAEQAAHSKRMHKVGALIALMVAFGGFFLSFFMYSKRMINPARFTNALSFWYRALQNKYYFDDFYIKGLIQRALLPTNNLLAKFDMGFYDRYCVDGWQSVNKFFYKVSNWFDTTVIDKGAVDGTGASVRLFNVLLRTVQNGKIQFYFFVMLVVLVGYIWALV